MTSRQAPADMSWLLANFADQVFGIAHVVAVSADGLLIGSSRGLPPDRAEQLAAVTAGLVSLSRGVSQCTDGGSILQTVVEMGSGFLFLMNIGDGSALAALAARNCDMGQVGYELTLLVDRVGTALAPAPRDPSARF
jgi:predicted regulator of Ras-like GTPase activity (Roadblock/LC7/MglB family)